MIRGSTDILVENAAVSTQDVDDILKRAFPDRCFSLAELGRKCGFAVHSVGNLNGSEAQRVLTVSQADLGVVLGTRILKPETFNIPKMGSINLHKGKVPEYRGMPPGFWELYDGVSTAGITVHFVDKGLDTGDIVVTSEVPILATDTPDSLLEKLHHDGAQLLALAVSMLSSGKATRKPQQHSGIKACTRPTRSEIATLRGKLPHWKRPSDLSAIARNLYLLLVYYSGAYAAVRTLHGRQKSRAAIYLFHRVNDFSFDVLTVDTKTFAAQLLAISKRYPFCSTSALVECVRNKESITPTTIAIHFDDCYRDILTNGAPIMRVLGVPATAFINSGFIDTDRAFLHDVEQYPFRYENFRSAEVREWAGLGFEVGSHTVNHVDLGKCPLEVAISEIVDCGNSLRSIIKKPVDLFSFPFGRVDNITAAAKKIVSEAGYRALFSAHGGFIGARTDTYDIPRMGASCRSSPLYLLLELEGLAPGQLASLLRNRRFS